MKVNINNEINDFKKAIDYLRNGVMGKISEYDKSLSDVGVELKSMGKVFKDIVPSLTESVGELSRMTDKTKQNKEQNPEN